LFFEFSPIHSKKEIATARYKGEVVKGLSYKTKMKHPSFESIFDQQSTTKTA